ncbi:MAG: zinc-dependent peptidase [Flavobacteriaceae bacterium]|nr:zinc-dependent peptidase [Flavobacteriaceae bacterium]
MMLFLQAQENVSWLAPYAYTIVLLGFCFFLFRVFENWFAAKYDRPFYRHYVVFRKLSSSQIELLKTELHFYNLLTKREKRQFQHRVATFISDKKFVGRDGFEITERVKTLIASVGCMVSFGRKNYEYTLIEYIIVYPNEFFSNLNNNYHKGEFNPRERALVLSWEHFEHGYQISNDNLNLGIHEFMHAMQLESKNSADIDSTRFSKQFQNILHRLTEDNVKEKLEETRFFREYAFTNQYEFMAVLAEYFFESPKDLKNHFPEIYEATKKLLNFQFAGY